jgi:hypothetical protein
MNLAGRTLGRLVVCLAIAAALPAQQLKPETEHDFDCYIQSAEARMEAAHPFLLSDSDSALNDRLVRSQQIPIIPANGPDTHKIAGGLIYDWVGLIFIPGVTLDRTIRMLQDYDHRAQYFPEILSTAKLLCRAGDNRFRFSMRLKEPIVADVESEVVWDHLDAHRWHCRSYSTSVKEIPKERGYVLRLVSYWRFSETGKGTYVQAETISLSREFSGFTRALGSMMGLSPEKSLRHTLASIKESLLKPGLQFASPPAGAAACGEAFQPGECAK